MHKELVQQSRPGPNQKLCTAGKYLQQLEKTGIHFPHVLVGSLNAVEAVSLLRICAVLGRVLHLVLPVGLVNIGGKMAYHDKDGRTR